MLVKITHRLLIDKIIRILLVLSIVISALSLFSSCSPKTYSVLKLEIENKKYEHLSLFANIRTSAGYDNGWETPGVSRDGHKWRFTVPDSINHSASYHYMVRIQPFNFEKHEERAFTFSAKQAPDVKCRVITLKNRVTKIKGEYVGSFSDTIRGLGYLLVDTFVMGPIFNYDVINMKHKNKTCKSELEIQVFHPYFESYAKRPYSFDERLSIVKKHPDSNYLFGALPYLRKSLNKNELNELFAAFSKKLQQSQNGKEIFDFINIEINPVSIDTLKLVNAKDDILEPIIRSNSKYTLVVFSASWCGPCHKQIPLLKEVFNHCSDKLDMVYISTDVETNEEAWNNMIEEEEVPWRSLFARKYAKGLSKFYNIEQIPYSLLVYPDGNVERIDVRYKSDKEKLYQLVDNTAL